MIERRCPDCGAKIKTARCAACATRNAARFAADRTATAAQIAKPKRKPRPAKKPPTRWANCNLDTHRRLQQVARTLLICLHVHGKPEGVTTRDVCKYLPQFNERTIKRDLYLLESMGLIDRRDKLDNRRTVWLRVTIDEQTLRERLRPA
jgi:hypothetical protein